MITQLEIVPEFYNRPPSFPRNPSCIMLSSNRRSLALWAFAHSAFDVVAHPLLSGHIISRADELLSEYDYVIVGGGASGLTVANRLTEEPGTFQSHV